MKNFGYTLFILLPLLIISCSSTADLDGIDFRAEMRNFVIEISLNAKGLDSSFLIVPQNGQELITDTGDADGKLITDYLESIDGTGREELLYGYYNDNEPTPTEDREYLMDFCLLSDQNGVEVLVTDYCSTQTSIDDSYISNNNSGFISFAADQRELNNIPDYPTQPYNINNNDVTDISDAMNFLYLINSENYAVKNDFVTALSATDYDLLIIDLFHNDEAFTAAEISQLKTKSNGGKRLVLCYMSIGEAENYRYYWEDSWKPGRPEWLENANEAWSGNYKVRYWEAEWQEIVFRGEQSYLEKIINAGFDGVYLDIIDAFEYFEEKYY